MTHPRRPVGWSYNPSLRYEPLGYIVSGPFFRAEITWYLKCYQFAIISPLGIQKYDSIFYTAEGAEREGRRSLMSDD